MRKKEEESIMPGFRDRRIGLLILALLVASIFIASPWKEPQPEGAPLSEVVKGPNWGIDITGGSRIMLRLEATQATIRLSDDSSDDLDEFVSRFSENLEVPVNAIGYENEDVESVITIEIGRYVSESRIISMLKEGEQLLEVKQAVSQATQDQVKNSLEMRVDPYGTLGAQFKPLGERNQYLQFEVALDLERAKTLLGKEGLPEVFVDNYRTVWSEHIRNVSRGTGPNGEWQVSFTLTEEGKERFADYTGRMSGIPDKRGHPGVIYLDRPSDSVLLFKQDLEEGIGQEAPQLGLEAAEYFENIYRFRYMTADRPETTLDEGHWFYLQVPAVKVDEDGLDPSSESYISSLSKSGELNQAILLGRKDSFPNIQDDSLVIDDEVVLPAENVTRMETERYIDWLNRVIGLESWPTLQPSITANVENLERGLRITTGTGEDARERAESLRIILSQRLPVTVTHISEEDIGGRLGEGFVRQAAFAGIVAFIVVGILIFSFYRKFKIVIPLLFTMACEVIITLGAASAVPDGLMSIGLPGIGGLIAVVGTGVDHQIIITDEVLGKKFSDAKRLPIDRRTGRAFSVIFAAAATTVAAMVALAAFGFGAMRGFAIVTLFGVLISVLVTRPAYAKIVGILLEREQESKEGR